MYFKDLVQIKFAFPIFFLAVFVRIWVRLPIYPSVCRPVVLSAVCIDVFCHPAMAADCRRS